MLDSEAASAKTPSTAIILQARLDSKRLPCKALLPLGGEPVLQRVMEALCALAFNSDLVLEGGTVTKAPVRILACPEDCAAAFSPFAKKCGFDIVTGSKDDVLARYCKAVRLYKPDRVVRATGDNPFVFADAAEAINAQALETGADYSGFASLPYGSGVEIVCAKTLLRAEKEAALPPEREHVCPYLYNNGDLFRLHRPLAPPVWQRPDVRLTIDTEEDYKRAVQLWEHLSPCASIRWEGAAVIKAWDELYAGKGGAR